jgi:DNA polymerase beta
MKMDKKKLIISKLEELKRVYEGDISKKWNLKALIHAIDQIKKYDKEIISGADLRKEIKGIGEKISKRIDEILETGHLSELNIVNYKGYIDPLHNLLLISGVGLKRAKEWFDLGYKNVDDVKNAIDKKIIKSTHHIDIGIKYYYAFQKKIPRDEIDQIKVYLKHIFKSLNKNILFEICGSYRRGLPESNDIDILLSMSDKTDDKYKICLKDIIDKLTEEKFIIDYLTLKGNTKFMGVCKNSRRIDIRVIDYPSYYTALLYFTGSKDFNLFIRKKALEQNMSLSEYSLKNLKDDSSIPLHSEKEIFDILGIDYLPPNKR